MRRSEKALQQLHSTQPQQTQTQTPVTAELVLKLESACRAIEMTLFALHHQIIRYDRFNNSLESSSVIILLHGCSHYCLNVTAIRLQFERTMSLRWPMFSEEIMMSHVVFTEVNITIIVVNMSASSTWKSHVSQVECKLVALLWGSRFVCFFSTDTEVL